MASSKGLGSKVKAVTSVPRSTGDVKQLAASAIKTKAKQLVAAKVAIVAIPLVLLLGLMALAAIGALASATGTEVRQDARVTSAMAAAKIPSSAMVTYNEAGKSGKVPWEILAAIGATETKHGTVMDATVGSASAYATPSDAKTSCTTVAHVGDSLSSNASAMIESAYHAAGVETAIASAFDGRQIDVRAPGDTESGLEVIQRLRGEGFAGCWVIALGTNDAASIVDATPVTGDATVDAAALDAAMASKIDSMMSALGAGNVVWVNAATARVSGGYAMASMARWNAALVQAVRRWPSLHVYDWAATAPGGFVDGVNLSAAGSTARAGAVAATLTSLWPAPTDPADPAGGRLGADIVVEADGQTYLGPMLIDARAIEGAGYDPQVLSSAAEFLAGQLRSIMRRDNPGRWSGRLDDRWIEDAELWVRAVAKMPIKAGTFQAAALPPVATCESNPTTLIGDSIGVAYATGAGAIAGLSVVGDASTTLAGGLGLLPATPQRTVVHLGSAGLGLADGQTVTSVLDAYVAAVGASNLTFIVPRDPGTPDAPSAVTGLAAELTAAKVRNPGLRVLDASNWLVESSLVGTEGGGSGEEMFEADGYTPTAAVAAVFARWLTPQLCSFRAPETPPTAAIPPSAMAQRIVDLAVALSKGKTLAGASCVGGAGALASIPANVAQIYATYGTYKGVTVTAAPKQPAEYEPLIPQMVVALQSAQSAGFSGESLVTLVAIAGRESRYDPAVLNDNSGTGDLSYGLWQINTIDEGLWNKMRTALGFAQRGDLNDPNNVARAARWLYDGGIASFKVPFHSWGPYKDVPPLWGGAADWVEPAFKVAVAYGFIAPDGSPAVAGSTTSPATSMLAVGCSGTGTALTPLQGPNCDGLRGTGATYLGVQNGSLTNDMLAYSDWGYLQPAAVAAWQQVVDAGVAAGFSADDFGAWNGGAGARSGSYSNHTIGLALDINKLAWTPTRAVPGERLPVAYAFDEPLYTWLRANAWQFGWCSPAWARPYYLDGTSTGGKDASGHGNHLEQWHFEFVGGSTYYNGGKSGDNNGPLGVPD